MSLGRIFRVCRSFLPLIAAGSFAACGSDSSSFGEPFTADTTDAGGAQSVANAGRTAAGSGGRGGSAGSVVDAGVDEDSGTYQHAGAAAGSSGGKAGAAGSAGHAAGSGGTAGAAGAAGTTAAVSFGDIFTGTIQLGCSCHNGGAGGLDLGSRASAYKNLVNVASSNCSAELRVVPGNPDASVLFHALSHTALGSCKVPGMPQGGSMLSQAKLDQIKMWITAGAPDN